MWVPVCRTVLFIKQCTSSEGVDCRNIFFNGKHYCKRKALGATDSLGRRAMEGFSSSSFWIPLVLKTLSIAKDHLRAVLL